MKLYNCIIDDGHDVYRAFCAAKNRKQLLEDYGGNGEFEKIKDVTNEYLSEGSLEQLEADLLRTGWGEGERRLIYALVEEHLNKR